MSFSNPDTIKTQSLPLVIMGLVFLINPLIGILAASLFACSQKSKKPILFVIFLLVLYLGALNTTKVPHEDMEEYLDMFNSVPQIGYIETMKFMSSGLSVKDVFYANLTFFSYYLFFGNQYFFILFISILTFSFAFVSIYRFGKNYYQPNHLIVSEILILAFFTQYFSLSWHIVRQELATSLFFFALSYRPNSLKQYIIWSVISVTTHSGMLPIILLALLPFMSKQLKIKHIVYILFFSFSFVAVVSSLASFILERFILGGQLEANVMRASALEGAHDATGEESVVVITMFTFFLLSISLLEIMRKSKIYPLVSNLCFVWSVLILCLSVSPLIQYRFFFIEYTFTPFLLFLFVKKYPLLLKVFCIIVVSVFIMRFYLNLNNVFQYISAENALLSPYFLLIRLF